MRGTGYAIVAGRDNRGQRCKFFDSLKICHGSHDGVDFVLLRMSRYVTVITARDVSRYIAYYGDKFLHTRAVTIVNNRDNTLHYAIEEETNSRTFLINSAVRC